jgi:hypothetical protein
MRCSSVFLSTMLSDAIRASLMQSKSNFSQERCANKSRLRYYDVVKPILCAKSEIRISS